MFISNKSPEEIATIINNLNENESSILSVLSLIDVYVDKNIVIEELSKLFDLPVSEVNNTLNCLIKKELLQLEQDLDAIHIAEYARTGAFWIAVSLQAPQEIIDCVNSIQNKSIISFNFSNFSGNEYNSLKEQYNASKENAHFLCSLLKGTPDKFYYSKISNLGTELEFPICNPAEYFDNELMDLLTEASQLEIFRIGHRLHVLNGNNGLNQGCAKSMYNRFAKSSWLKSELFLHNYIHLMIERFILEGNFEQAKNYIDISSTPETDALKALNLFFYHGSNAALPELKKALKRLRSETSKNIISFSTIADWFYFIALIHEGSQLSISEAINHNSRINRRETAYPHSYRLLYCLYTSKNTNEFNIENLINEISSSNIMLDKWIGCFVLYWLGTDKTLYEDIINQVCSLTLDTGMTLLSGEIIRLKNKLEIPLNNQEEQIFTSWNSKMTIPMVEMVQQTPKWELVLSELTKALNLEGTYIPMGNARIIWEFSINSPNSFELHAKEQIRLKSGNWSSGKIIDCSKYIYGSKPYPEYVTEQDKRIMEHFRTFNPWHLGNENQDWSVFQSMIGHPAVYHIGNTDKPVEVLKGEPVLVLSEDPEGYSIRFSPDSCLKSYYIDCESDFTLRVYSYSPIQIETAKILSQQSIFPSNSIDRLKNIFKALSNLMSVHTGIAGANDLTSTASVTADPRIYVRLLPQKDTLNIKLLVKPFGEQGPAMLPTYGQSDVFTTISGQKLHTKRDISKEIESFNELKDSCPSLHEINIETPELTSFTPEDSLQLLYELQETNAVLEWPENYTQKRIRKIKFNDFSLSVNKQNEWFELSGELQIGEDKVLELKQLIKLYDGKSKFIAISENEFIAITDELKKRIEDLKAFTEQNGDELIFHNLAIPAMEEFFSETNNITFDKSWKEAVVRIKKADKIQFETSENLKAVLRDYQVEGFKWLSRMAYLGMGACLADDMGLGKTVEALSIIQTRASLGPSFVLAPTSVCMNWYNECKRFTPDLNPILFGISNRKEIIQNLSPNDLIICSYGILQKEIELLENVNWATLALDEAQAIKNMSTSRSQAAMRLHGGFKMLMTGTPIENHLGELWNLFRFLNHGLLGSLDSFNNKFANPIQIDGNKEASLRLKTLVQPFVLRRTKDQVLQNLPPRTEITLHVDLSQEEAALYESYRQNAIENIQNEKNENKSIIVLAEIMKLRRLCCNPSLVAPELGIKSSKLSLLENIIADLKANGHKALVFSQFVDHLSIIKKMFDEKGYTYKYLDGMTPTKQRTKAIDEFQNGMADFFLISLRAGGLGLNLTAADYVIHLDPWWNPAVEDQASDRAHRIGQTKPVTIYKLITTNTIEEKIVQLHGKKRGLADELLEGSDLSGRISTKELFALISRSALIKPED